MSIYFFWAQVFAYPREIVSIMNWLWIKFVFFQKKSYAKFQLTSSMDLRVDPRYTLIIWHGKRPRQVACKYLSKLIVLTAKSEFCNPNGIGVSLESSTSWKASCSESIKKLNFFNMELGSAVSINLRMKLVYKW